jgi:hypothetical protein
MASGAVIKYPGSVFGYNADTPEGVAGDVEYFIASAAITKGQAVTKGSTLDLVTAATTGATGPTIVGLAQRTVAAGASVPVTYQGRGVALVATTVTAGNLLGVSATNAGFLAPVTAGVAITQYGDAGKVIAVAEESAATDTTTEVNVRILRL